ncbi:MAG: phage major capsid protein [Acidobacteriota bacterium]
MATPAQTAEIEPQTDDKRPELTGDAKEIVETIQQKWGELKAFHADELAARDDRLAKIEGLAGEEQQKLKNIANEVLDLELKLARLAGSGRQQPVPANEDVERVTDPYDANNPRRLDDYEAAQDSYIRFGKDGVTAKARPVLALGNAFQKHIENGSRADQFNPQAALSTDYGPGGGIWARPHFESEVERMLQEMNPLREFARVVLCSGGSYEGVIRNGNHQPLTQRGEREGRPTNTERNLFVGKKITIYEYTATPALTQTSIEDSVVNLEAELVDDSSIQFGVTEGYLGLRGKGRGEPEGLLEAPDIPEMASGVADSFTHDSLIKLMMNLPPFYRKSARYFMGRDALVKAMTAKDGNEAYRWQPSNQEGIPSLLHGHPWTEFVDLDNVAPNGIPVIFANMYRTYRIADRRGLRIVRDEVTETPFVKFNITRRWGSRVWMGEAARKLRIAA